MIKNKCKNEVQLLLKWVQHYPGERSEKISGLRIYKTLQVLDQVSVVFRAAENRFFCLNNLSLYVAKHPCCLPDGQWYFSVLSHEIIPSERNCSSSFPRQIEIQRWTMSLLSGCIPGKYTSCSEVQTLFPRVFEVQCQAVQKNPNPIIWKSKTDVNLVTLFITTYISSDFPCVMKYKSLLDCKSVSFWK